MFLRLAFLPAVFLIGCATVTDCDYRLYENGWVETKVVPENLIDEYNKNDFWFTNDRGDFFACPELVKKGVCINVYKTYRLNDDGSYEYDHIVCMQ